MMIAEGSSKVQEMAMQAGCNMNWGEMEERERGGEGTGPGSYNLSTPPAYAEEGQKNGERAYLHREQGSLSRTSLTGT
jgi:hypothetical protein